MFTLAISCLITSNLHWFMDLTFLSSYAMLLFTASNFTSITHHIHSWVLFLLWLHLFILFGVISSLSPVLYWAPTDLGSSSFSVISFCLFILFIGFSRQEFWSGLLFPSPVNYILSDLSIMPFILSGPTCHGSVSWVRQGYDPCDKAPTIRPIQRDVFPGVFSQGGLECQVSIQRKTAHCI